MFFSFIKFLSRLNLRQLISHFYKFSPFNRRLLTDCGLP
ncbi:hypothetical protein CAMGR0001_0671 [Campylobacter gracilis RM3268]|uniref:Uncharacterized protein n=1 Tax=Campylobacter gracilis RM3268 TaxID=553220 RepID=C8PDW5_9BACT|nr:hypothetical protein CAMGR0001_0671 [Campylobacter gracilis RM3268]